MIVLSNRSVYLFGEPVDDGVHVRASWLIKPDIAGTEQQLWDRTKGTIFKTVIVPPDTAQVHTDTFFPYAPTSLAVAANNAKSDGGPG